jgi:CubicO group peptidase (beta-lactamase class C family)
LVAKEGKVILKKAYGYANLEHHIPNTVETKFRIWSLTKSFTAMAIMMLYEQKHLTFEDDVSQFLPEFSYVEGITIANLLNHTSGLINYTSIPKYNGKLNKLRLSKQDVIKLILGNPLQFMSGTSFSYNNSGYFLLGMIIEKISGLSFEDYLTRYILEPLGMKDTGIDDNRKVIPQMASSYHASGIDFIQCEYMNMSSSFSVGAMYSTIDDLFLWDNALYTEKLVSKTTLDMAFNPSFNYGFGWFIDEQFNRKRIHHGGAYRGFRSEMHRYPNERVTAIMLTNRTSFKADPIGSGHTLWGKSNCSNFTSKVSS